MSQCAPFRDSLSSLIWKSVQVKKELKGQTLAGLINNAGIANHAVLMHQPIDEFRRVLEINLIGTLAVIQVRPRERTCSVSGSVSCAAPGSNTVGQAFTVAHAHDARRLITLTHGDQVSVELL